MSICSTCDDAVMTLAEHNECCEMMQEQAAATERARIVAWLRSHNVHGDSAISRLDPVGSVADAIEAGEHLKDKP